MITNISGVLYHVCMLIFPPCLFCEKTARNVENLAQTTQHHKYKVSKVGSNEKWVNLHCITV